MNSSTGRIYICWRTQEVFFWSHLFTIFMLTMFVITFADVVYARNSYLLYTHSFSKTTRAVHHEHRPSQTPDTRFQFSALLIPKKTQKKLVRKRIKKITLAKEPDYKKWGQCFSNRFTKFLLFFFSTARRHSNISKNDNGLSSKCTLFGRGSETERNWEHRLYNYRSLRRSFSSLLFLRSNFFFSFLFKRKLVLYVRTKERVRHY